MSVHQPAGAVAIDEATADAIGVEAYTYLYPLLLMEVTRGQMTNVIHVDPAAMRGPAGTFLHVPAFPPADFRDVVRPNFDTLYSSAWLDVSDEPFIVSVPAAEDQYYLLPVYDMWGEVFACPGTRTTGSAALDFAIVAPGWAGDLPDGVRRYEAPTPVVWIIGRSQASVATYDKVHAFQAGLTVAPLSAWGGEPPAVEGRIDPAVDGETPPLRQVFALDAATFFGRAAELIKRHPPHIQDSPVIDRMGRLGFEVGESFDLGAADPAARAALERAVPAAQKLITERQKVIGTHVNGWLMNVEAMGNYGTNYLRRACVELVGLGANLAEDAVYPLSFVDADGAPYTGASDYALHFERDQLPPVNAFWSLTLYDDEGFQVANRLDRFAIGDRDALAYGDDGSLDILVSHATPSEGESNWLPAPEGSFNLTLRLYYPKPEVLEGTWTPPAVAKRR